MTENTKHRAITIDLNQFKLHIDLKKRIELTLHFDSPSRRFYLSVIAFVISEMKRLGKITSIPLEGNHDLLVLLNDTVGGSAGSSEKENLLSRIYRKWKNSLPNLEEAPLFKVIGRQKKYDEGAGKTYHFTEAEKDNWANLFEYIGSEKNVRLKFALDKIGAGLDDVDIIYEESMNGDAWDRFLSSLKKKVEEVPEAKAIQPISEVLEPPASLQREQEIILPSRYRWMALVAMVIMIVGAGIWVIWELSLKPALVETASMDRKAFPLPDKPSIAVLPFVNMSDDRSQEFFSDGLTEEIITALSKTPKLFVIARNSSFIYKGKGVNVQQVSRELGVKYVLEGTVRRSGDQLRITAQLIDATNGNHLWAERYDRELKDIFAIQDEVTIKILSSILGRTFMQEGRAQQFAKGASNVEAFLKHLEGAALYLKYTEDDNALAAKKFEEAIALDPQWSFPYTGLALTQFIDFISGRNPQESLSKANECAEKAISLDQTHEYVFNALRMVRLAQKRYEESIAAADQAIKVAPGSGAACAWLAETLLFCGEYKKAMVYFEKALRLNPFPEAYYFTDIGAAHFILENYEEAVSMYKKALSITPMNFFARSGLIATYVEMGRMEEAKAETEEMLKIYPKFTSKGLEIMAVWKDAKVTERYIDAFRKAGLERDVSTN